MEHSVYLESSVVELKPRILDFLTCIVDKAKEAKDYVISMKRRELAELTGKDTRTVSRYLNELEDKRIIQLKGVRGRTGGTVILFNSELIRFNTSDKALINSDEPINIDKIIEEKYPKKKKNPKKTTRNRRTKQQMVEARILKNKQQVEIDRLNDRVEELGGVPNWAWFESTEDPIGNYRTYLITRMYNRYSALFTDRHNAEVEVYAEGNLVPRVSNDYDVLPKDFYGSSRWQQFKKFKDFCEDNNIDPATYLSAQFSRSVFTCSSKNNKKALPFVNTLTTDAAYEVYIQYCDYQKKFSNTYASYQMVPMQFMDDFVIRTLNEAYDTAHSGAGVMEIRHAIKDFVTGEGSSSLEESLLGFYRITESNLRCMDISLKSRDVIKKYLMLQMLSLTGGIRKLPSHLILGSEMTRAILVSIEGQEMDRDKARHKKAMALGMLTHPHLDAKKQKKVGSTTLYQYNVLYETPKVLKLVMERKNLHLSLHDINKALKEYGREKIPVDDYSVLDVGQITEFMEKHVEIDEEVVEVPRRYEDIVDKKDWVLTGAVNEVDHLDSLINEALNE